MSASAAIDVVRAAASGDDSTQNRKLDEFLFTHRNTIAAASGSFVSTIAGFPLDSVKSRLQVKRYSSVLDCVQRTYQDEGFRGFFRGVTIPLVTITGVRTASFTIYTATKDFLLRKGWANDDSLAGIAKIGFAGGASSGMALSLGTCAFEFTKISQQLEYLIAIKRGEKFEPKGTLKGFASLYRKGGVLGLYTGFNLHALRDTLGTGFYFGGYDAMRYFLSNHSEIDAYIPRHVSTFACGSLAGIYSWALIYPIDLVKAKVQRNALAGVEYEKPWSIFRRLSSGGIRRLYRGLGVSATRSLLTHGLMWTLLEGIRGTIEKKVGYIRADASSPSTPTSSKAE